MHVSQAAESGQGGVHVQVAMHADMGLNMIRLWGGCNATRPAFLHACDALGILVWWEFWITGDCMGRGATKVRYARWYISMCCCWHLGYAPCCVCGTMQ